MTGPRTDVLEAARQRRVALDLVPETPALLHPEPLPRHRVVRWLWSGVTVLLVLAVAVAGIGWVTHLDDPFRRNDVDAAVLSASDLEAYRAWAATAPASPAAPIVMTYHDIQETAAGGSEFVVTAADFERQMRMLHEAGYSTLTADQFVAYRAGRYTPPPRSVLITFDDGTAGLWRYADSVLERYGFHAVSFVITGRVGTAQPYYLTWELIERMAASGRWDFGSHTADMHTRVPIGPNGQLGGSLSHREWRNGAYEPQKAFESRVRADLRRSIDDLVGHGLPRPRLFAYPFSDVVAKGVAAEQARAPRTVVSEFFDTAFVDVDPGALPASRRELTSDIVDRLEVFSKDTDRSVFDRLVAMTTLPVSSMRPLEVDQHWLEYAGYPAPVEVRDGALVVDARSETYVFADWAPQRTPDWVDYTVACDVRGIPADGSATAGLRARSGGRGELAVKVGFDRLRVTTADNAVLLDVAIPGSRAHSLSVRVLAGETEVRVDGVLRGTFPVQAGPQALGGFGAVFSRSSPATQFPTLHDLRVQPAP